MNRYVWLGVVIVAVVVAALALSFCSEVRQAVDTSQNSTTTDEQAGADQAGTDQAGTDQAGADQAGADAGASTTGEETATATSEGTSPPAEESGAAGDQDATDPNATDASTETGSTAGSSSESEAAEAPILPTFDIVRVGPDGSAVIAGRAAPGSTVTVTVDGQAIGSAVADERGEWVLLPGAAMPAGDHEIALTAQTPTGETVAAASSVLMSVPEAGAGGETLAVLVPDDDAAVSVPLQTPSSDASGGDATAVPVPETGIVSGDLALDSVDYDEAGNVTVGGRAAPGAKLRIYLDNRLAGEAAAVAGRWQSRLTLPVEQGLHSLRVDQIDAAGAVLARVETPFLREVSVALPAEKRWIVQPGNSLWRIARRTYGEGLRYTVIYEANRSQIRDPDLIYPGQIFAMPEEAAAP